MSSIVEICNIGLQSLGVQRMAAYPDTVSTSGKEMTFAYEPTKVALLRRHRWNFAKKRVQLAADTTGPTFDFANYFTLPSDCLRILPPTEVGVDWRLEGRKIATDYAAPLDLVYLYNVEDPNEMDPLFREALGIDLALRTCKKLTGSNTLKADLYTELKVILSDAKAMNAIENISGDLPEDIWITCRN